MCRDRLTQLMTAREGEIYAEQVLPTIRTCSNRSPDVGADREYPLPEGRVSTIGE
jgi:hypothetical protein